MVPKARKQREIVISSISQHFLGLYEPKDLIAQSIFSEFAHHTQLLKRPLGQGGGNTNDQSRLGITQSILDKLLTDEGPGLADVPLLSWRKIEV